MPAVQPAELWQESGRWEQYGPELLRIKDRHQRDFCFGPTHEEVVSDIVRREVRSYRQLPLNLYQIQTKFRDEIRPRFGVMRGREFVMKDAYSFHADNATWSASTATCTTPTRIFTRLGLKFRAVAADTGSIGGTGSHEFHVLADSGEDAIAYCPQSDYAANVELAEALAPPARARRRRIQPLPKVHTPGVKTCRPGEFAASRGAHGEGGGGRRPDGRARAAAPARRPRSSTWSRPASSPQLKPVAFRHRRRDRACVRRPAGLARPGRLQAGPVIADRAVAAMSDFVTGANEDDHHCTGANFGRDCPEPALPTSATSSRAIRALTARARWKSAAASRSATSSSCAPSIREAMKLASSTRPAKHR
jgi:prolyl-tRNA synthetase